MPDCGARPTASSISSPIGHAKDTPKRELLTLRDELRPNDLVLTSNPWVTDYYVGRTDGFLRQRARLAHLGSDQRIWLITEHKFREFSSASYRKDVVRSFTRANRSSRIPIYRSQ